MNIHDGVTEEAALQLQRITGADLFEIRTERHYRNAFLGTAATAWIEEALNTRPKLAAQPENLDAYDVIYVGFPIWWFNAPMAVGSFLESYDLSGKTVVPFCTSQDNGIDICMDYIREVSGGATVLDGFRFRNAVILEIVGGVIQRTDIDFVSYRHNRPLLYFSMSGKLMLCHNSSSPSRLIQNS
jgi:flavodoxin